MTIRLRQSGQTWIGTSKDDRPENVQAGATVYETDTHNEYWWDGFRWSLRAELPHVKHSETDSLLKDILDELKAVRFHLQQVTDIDV